MLKYFAGTAGLVFGVSILVSVGTGTLAHACESVFCKIGDGPRHVVEGVVAHPQRIFPPCWGSDRCDDPAKAGPTQGPHPSKRAKLISEDCKDAVTGADRADNTTRPSSISLDEARNEIIRRYQTADLCQANGDTSRITKPGSGRWM